MTDATKKKKQAGQTYIIQITDTRPRRFFCPFHCGETFVVNARAARRDVGGAEMELVERRNGTRFEA